jgi:hypothetical protein
VHRRAGRANKDTLTAYGQAVTSEAPSVPADIVVSCGKHGWRDKRGCYQV